VPAIVPLSVEEAEIALYGALPEPSYRPFPGSLRERELEDVDDGEEAVERETGNPTFSRIGKAETWKRSTRVHALLGIGREDGFWVIALGSVEGSSRTQYRGGRNLDIRVRHLLSEQFRLEDVIEKLASGHQQQLRKTLDGQLRLLSSKLGVAVTAALREQVPEVGEALDQIQEELNAEAIALARERMSRPAVLLEEAGSSALHLFTAGWHRLTPEPGPTPSDFALGLEESAGIIESDVIADDAVVFPGWDRSVYSQRGWWEFRSGGRRLLVKNINASPQESRTGADLVYVRRDPEVFVLVQYKLLDQLADGQEIFRPDGRLNNQVTRLLSLENTPRGSESPDDTVSYRLGSGFSFVKFVLPSAARPERPGELTPGYYFPSEFARRVLLAPASGPQGGVVHYVASHRSISSETFARLVRDTWVGSTGDATVLLREIFGFRDRVADLVLAVEEPVGLGQDVGSVLVSLPQTTKSRDGVGIPSGPIE